MGVYENIFFPFLNGGCCKRSSDNRFMGGLYTEIVINNYGYKKILPCECKRHTASCVASACCASGGTPSSHGGGVPPSRPGQDGGYPRYPPPSRPGLGTPNHPDLAGLSPTIQTWLGYPPTSRPGSGTPTIQTWLGYPQPSRPGWGTPYHPDLAGVPIPHNPDLAVVPPTIQTWLGYLHTIQM